MIKLSIVLFLAMIIDIEGNTFFFVLRMVLVLENDQNQNSLQNLFKKTLGIITYKKRWHINYSSS